MEPEVGLHLGLRRVAVAGSTVQVLTEPGGALVEPADDGCDVLDDLAPVEPVLRRSADVVLDTTASLADVVAEVLRAAGDPDPPIR